MAYKISNTDGTTLLILADNTVDESVTSLSLVGKNLNAYGQYINNNFIKLLANSASPISNQPRSPLVGQLWYDTTAKRLKVYDGKFKPVTGAIVSTTVPTDPSTGDLWWDSGNFQLSAWNGRVWTIVGPPFKKSIGDNGWILPSDQHPVQNLDGVTQKVTLLKNFGETIGLITTASFTTNLNFPVNYLSSDFVGLNFSITKGLTIFGDIYSKGKVTADSLSASSLSIYGNIFTTGKIVAQELDIQYTTVTTVSIKTDDVYTSFNTSSSTSTTTGAIVVAGGIGVGKGIYVGGTVTATTAVITGNATIGILTATTATVTGNATVGGEITVSNYNQHGGTGFAGMFTLVNTSATNGNKYVRINSVGSLQIVDSTYQNTIFEISNSGTSTIGGNLIVNNFVGISTTTQYSGALLNVNGSGYVAGNFTATGTIVGNVVSSGIVKTKMYGNGLDSLPSPDSVGAGARAFVNNANSTTFNAAYVGGGSYYMPVFSNGANWYIG
jgi:cytoskeletal protein CcmA (bactofilin family)